MLPGPIHRLPCTGALMDDRLLKPGWAGELNPKEFKYVKSQLLNSPSLKRKWGFRPSAKRFSEDRIRAVAREGKQANQTRVLASVEKHNTEP